MPTTLTHGIQLPDKGSVDWYSSMQSNYNLIDTHLGDTDVHVTAEDKANWNSKQGSLSQDQLDAIAQVATNTDDIATLQSGKANASHTHSSSDITDIGDYATKDYVDNSISGLVDNAPDALNTLNELSAALNDDSNFASTVTTALAAKANSADLATVATSGSYNDLDDKPTIPTNTSDLTNDSDFVDTSNSAVASGITSAKVIDYDTHIADTDIHVTTADKNRWNNNTYVFRYSSTALTDSSTNSNALLDNTDNLKVGDKVIDSSGVLFSITAIDTANSTFTVGTALIDLAQDSDVVHKSGNETVGGAKTFSDNLTIYNSDDTVTPKGLAIRNAQWGIGESGGTTVSNINFLDKNSSIPASVMASKGIYGQSFLRFSVRTKDSQNTTYSEEIYYDIDTSGNVEFRSWHDNTISLGTSIYKWKDVQTNLVNGLEPSALSLPSGNTNDVIDISSYLVNLDGTDNTYVAPANGWIAITMSNSSSVQAYIRGFWGHQVIRPSAGRVRFLMPILKNQKATIFVFDGTVDNARFIPCQGNV